MNHLDQALRTMLRERAADITAVPADFSDLDSLDVLTGGAERAEQRRARWWMFAAAAALVALVVGVTAAVRDRDGRRPHPVAPAISHPHPTPAPSTRATTRPSCPATLPATWAIGLWEGSSTLGGARALALAVSGTGTMVATRDFGSSRDVVIVPPGGTPQKIFTVPDPDRMQVVEASIEGDWVLIPVALDPRNASTVIPTVRELVLVNIATHATRTIVHLDPSTTKDPTTIDGAVMEHGQVFWDVRSNFATRAGKIMLYSIKGGHKDTAKASAVSAPVAHPARVSWSGGYRTFAEVLPPVVNDVTASDASAAQSLVSDGSAYAWITKAGRIGWWAPGAAAPVELRPPSVPSGPQHFDGLLVAGRYVYVDQGSQTDGVRRLIDMRNGATAATTAVLLYAGHGIFGGYPGPQATESVLRVDTTALPELHC